MIDKIEYSDEESPDPSGFNSEPIGLKEISEKEFAQSDFFTYSPVALEYRQVMPKNGKVYSLRIFWMNTTPGQANGFAMHSDYWGGKIRYYKVGCDHKYRELSASEAKDKGHHHSGNCYHVTECIHCGRIFSYDSGD